MHTVARLPSSSGVDMNSMTSGHKGNEKADECVVIVSR